MEKLLPKIPKDTLGKISEHVFRAIDKDKDSSITFLEFMIIYEILTWGDSETIMEKLFEVFDVDGTGAISKAEMKTVVKDMDALFVLMKQESPRASLIFSQMDTNQDNFIDKQEFVSSILDNNQEYGQNLALMFVKMFGSLGIGPVDIRACYDDY